MNKKFDIVSMILIVALTIILIAFVFNYFTNSNETAPVNSNLSFDGTNIDIQNVSGSNAFLISTPVDSESDKIMEDAHIIDTIMSGEQENAVTQNSGESNGGIIDSVKENTPEEPLKDTNPLIITSDDNISDKEKKEVLKELDQTLMDLLEVIETVQIVDESRLPTDESEVQP